VKASPLKLLDSILSIIRNVAEINTIPSFSQMTSNTQDIAQQFRDIVEVTQVGISGNGISIEMISIGVPQICIIYWSSLPQ